MTLRLALCFRLNQDLGEYAAVASRACYRGFLETLLSHPRLTFNLSLSGTLIHALQYLDPKPLDLVRQGLAQGQFFLMGSTYSQNMLLPSDDWDNAQQIGLHRAALAQAFGVHPTAFWSPEGTWRTNLARLLLQSGYRSVLVESHILRRSGASLPGSYLVPEEGGPLLLLWDDEALRARLDSAIWFHQPQDVLPHLLQLAADPRSHQFFPACAESAEAMGLWGYEQGLDPRADWQGLDELLTALEQHPELELKPLGESPEPIARLPEVAEGWAESMDRCLTNPQAPGHEDGFQDWEDFIRRSPKIVRFRHVCAAVRNRLTALGSAWSDPGWEGGEPLEETTAYSHLFRMAIHTFCLHQYRFGCAGVGGKGDPAWEGVVSGLAILRSAELSEARSRNQKCPAASIEDVTGDGQDEILLNDGHRLAILSHWGGRLLYWFDLSEGRQFVGNQLAVPEARFVSDARLPEFRPVVSDWLPDQGSAPGPGPAEFETPPTRRNRHLPEWLAAELKEPLPIWPRPQKLALSQPLFARRRALNDFISMEGQETRADPEMDFRLEGDRVSFLRFFGYRLEMTKQVRLVPDGLRATYRFLNRDDTLHRVQLRIVSEFCPDLETVVRSPRATLRPIMLGRDQPGVVNTATQTGIVVQASRPLVAPPDFSRALLAIELGLKFELRLEPGKAETLTVHLRIHSLHSQVEARRAFRRVANWEES
jgi:hypothetical protein